MILTGRPRLSRQRVAVRQVGNVARPGTQGRVHRQGYPTVDDCYNTAHDYAVKCTFPNGIEMIVDSRSPNGILFEGSKGRMFVNRGRITGTPIEIPRV